MQINKKIRQQLSYKQLGVKVEPNTDMFPLTLPALIFKVDPEVLNAIFFTRIDTIRSLSYITYIKIKNKILTTYPPYFFKNHRIFWPYG